MPSGSKKRKAAKKKKEKETEINSNPSTTYPQGNDEVKSQDEKGSNGGSPAHGEHDHPFNEEEEESDPSAAQPSDAAASMGLEEVSGDSKIGEAEEGKEGVVVIEWDMKSEGSESRDVSVGRVEAVKESHNGNRSSSTSSSSDEAETVKNAKDESHNSIKETEVIDELVKSMDSLKAKMMSITQNVPEEEITQNVLVEEITQNVLVDKTSDSTAESSADPVKALVSAPEVQRNDNENGLLEKSMGSQVEATNVDAKKSEDKEHSSSDQNVRTLSLEESKPREFDNKVSASASHSSIPESTIVAEHVKDSDTPECSENK
ncbi:hypothetical protein VNO78_03136 [Psophocarpus tetragonolobus]|uniref:Uncharacterized protein n=1 Tax=Psophocarpus tetragonolobus TaxID=3891 RepID=A0AAN9T2K6_PSOTE